MWHASWTFKQISITNRGKQKTSWQECKRRFWIYLQMLTWEKGHIEVGNMLFLDNELSSRRQSNACDPPLNHYGSSYGLFKVRSLVKWKPYIAPNQGEMTNSINGTCLTLPPTQHYALSAPNHGIVKMHEGKQVTKKRQNGYQKWPGVRQGQPKSGRKRKWVTYPLLPSHFICNLNHESQMASHLREGVCCNVKRGSNHEHSDSDALCEPDFTARQGNSCRDLKSEKSVQAWKRGFVWFRAPLWFVSSAALTSVSAIQYDQK